MIERKWIKISERMMLGGIILSYVLPGAVYIIWDSLILVMIAGLLCLALIIGGVAVMRVYCSCPHCGSRSAIRHRQWQIEGRSYFCPKCGKRIMFDYEEDTTGSRNSEW